MIGGEFNSEPTDVLAHELRALQSAIWPRRTQAELLLDLGERKRWGQADLRERNRELSTWLSSEGVVGAVTGSGPPAGVAVTDLKAALARALPPGDGARAAGTSALISRLAPAVGANPKTLANSLAGGLRPARPDHRWLLALHHAVAGSPPVGAWLFHRRTPQAVAAALSSGIPSDAGNALLLFSLIALWQRRRPTPDARGNRGQPRPRRLTPKPVAALGWQLITPGQLAPLCEIGVELGDDRGAALGLLGIECALTEAHLGPHASRGPAADQEALVDSGEGFLRGAETALGTLRANGLVDAAEACVIAYRIARMRTWRDGASAPTPSAEAAATPYVGACVALDDLRGGKINSLPPFRASTPGLAMLLPQLRAAGARILP